MPRLSKIGAAALAAFGWSSGSAGVTASYLVVAGGGGGATGVGGSANGGGGGAGGYLSSTTSLNPTLSYTVTVGAGGATNANGSNSQFGTLTASVGGGSGGYNTGNGQTGGSGGGASSWVTSTAGSGTSGQGNAGGTQVTNNGTGGGGGAGAVGGNASGVNGGNGGAGTASSISGTSVTYAGGGGGSTNTGGTAGTGGSGGGGAGGISALGTAGTANLGGGGGGGASSAVGGAGGSGVVIISYAGAQQFGGGVVTSVGGNTIHTFNTSGTLSPITSLSASYLVVAGGGSGGYGGGGGGAGGLLTGSGLTIDTNSIYTVTVGAGGAGVGSASGNAGTNSIFNSVTANGGGYGATYNAVGGNGGSGGGGGANNKAGGTGSQGNNGGAGGADVPFYSAGGGGGSSAVGGTGNSTGAAGNGGAGTANSLSGSSVTYAGGGGGSVANGVGGTAGSGGTGGGGAGSVTGSGTAGTANLGGGGGGAWAGGGGSSGNGGSGIVIISYAGTQQMAGGTVTSVGGNTIHTFTSSGYLTPIKLVGRSLRFRNSASASLTRTPASASNRKTFTLSAWIKRGIVNAGTSPHQFLYSASTSSTFNAIDLYANNIRVNFGNGTYLLVTNALYRDPAAWYHIVLAVDTTQATSTNRVLLYVNGVQVTSFSTATYPTQNYDTSYNNTVAQRFGVNDVSDYFDGYMTEVNFIDGQALTPSSFGGYSSYGQWQPAVYGGSYGTNGFYLPFSNNASTTTLGYDFSPNGNNWTTNNISVTAGTTYDSMTDVPTLTSATAANYCVWNAVAQSTVVNGTVTRSNGNLTSADGGTTYGLASFGTIASTTGKWYWEVTLTAASNVYANIGVVDLNSPLGAGTHTGICYRQGNGYKDSGSNVFGGGGAGTSYGAAYAAGDVIGVALDLTAGTITFYKNGASQGVAFTSISGNYTPAVGDGQNVSSYTFDLNCGQRPFTYTPPSGFVALNTYNL